MVNDNNFVGEQVRSSSVDEGWGQICFAYPPPITRGISEKNYIPTIVQGIRELSDIIADSAVLWLNLGGQNDQAGLPERVGFALCKDGGWNIEGVLRPCLPDPTPEQIGRLELFDDIALPKIVLLARGNSKVPVLDPLWMLSDLSAHAFDRLPVPVARRMLFHGAQALGRVHNILNLWPGPVSHNLSVACEDFGTFLKTIAGA